MLATGIRVVRGPDWVWENQGKSFVVDLYFFYFGE